jgi:multidrug resistance protein
MATNDTAIEDDDKNDTASITRTAGGVNNETVQPRTKDEPHNEQVEVKNEPATTLERTATNDRPYTSFNSRQKAIIVLVATLGGSFSPFTTNIYFPAIDIISHALNVSISDVGLTITTYMIFQGVSPSFTSAIADDYGRRPAYLLGFVVFMAANLGLALNNTYAGLLVLRCLQSAGSSGLVTLMQGTIADIVTSAERGKYIAITSLAGILAPSIAPIVGGALAQHLGWHSVFWFLLILGGVYIVPLALFFPETCRAVVGDGTLEPPKWNRCLTDISRQKRQGHQEKTEGDTTYAEQEKQKARRSRGQKWDIFGPLLICLDPETAIILFYLSVIYSGFYVVSTTLTVQFHNIYGLSSTLQGLLFLPQAVGTIFAALTNSRSLDWNFKRHARKAGLEVDRKKQADLLKMPVERARLQAGFPFLVSGAIFIIIYGWLLEAKVHIAGPIILLGLIGYTMLAGFNPLSVLIIDLHRSRPATASAATNLARCLLGAGASAVANPMIEAMGNGWTFTLVGLIELAVLPILILPYIHGMKWRAKKREKEEEKKRHVEGREGD